MSDLARSRRHLADGHAVRKPAPGEPSTLGGIEAGYMQGILPTPPRLELCAHRGEHLLLSWYMHSDGEHVRAVTRVELDGERIARIQNYFFTPDLIADVCRELELSFRVNGYRYWLSGC